MNLEPVVDTKHAWGYYTPDSVRSFRFGASEISAFRVFVYVHDTCNILSIFLSPIIGIIRIAIAFFVECKYGNQEGFSKDNLAALHRFCRMQQVRGLLEVLCLGPLLGTVVDGVMTLKHHNMLCFSSTRTF